MRSEKLILLPHCLVQQQAVRGEQRYHAEVMIQMVSGVYGCNVRRICKKLDWLGEL